MHEPAATTAMLRATTDGKPIFRALDVAEIYGRHTGRGPRIPQVGLAVSAKFLESAPDVVAAAHAACVEASAWANANPDEAGAAAGPVLGLPAPVVAASVPHVRLEVISARQAREDIELYFQSLMELSPAIVGGKLPDADFYWG
jgi:NitT/TauT family transport system substrate-binding protein